MNAAHLGGWLAWATIVAAYVSTAVRLGRVGGAPAVDGRAGRRGLTLVRKRPRSALPPRSHQGSSTTISNLLTPQLVLPTLAARVKSEALEALAAHLARAHPAMDPRDLAAALHARELQSTCALENGVAIPHVRVPGLAGPLATLARSAAGIACGAADGRPTHLFLLLVVPAEAPGGHLRLLAGAARLLSDARCRARLLAADGADELLAALREHEARAQRSLRAA